MYKSENKIRIVYLIAGTFEIQEMRNFVQNLFCCPDINLLTMAAIFKSAALIIETASAFIKSTTLFLQSPTLFKE